MLGQWFLAAKHTMVSIPQGDETVPVPLPQRQEGFPIATFTPRWLQRWSVNSAHWHAWDKVSRALRQAPAPTELPAIFGGLRPKLEVFMVSNYHPSLEKNKI